jgi:hypothetical protein
MAITTIADINADLPGQLLTWRRTPTNIPLGTHHSTWINNSGSPPAGSAPSSGLAGDIPTDATTGAMSFQNPSSGNTYLARLRASAWQSAASVTITLYDRLWHNSGIAVTSGAQTINSVALTRPDANGASVEAWWEVYVIMGVGTPTVTLTYTNSAGTASRSGSSGALTTTMVPGRTGPFSLAAGDTGVRSIQTWNASATFTSGTIGLVMRRFVTSLTIQNGTTAIGDALAVGLPRIYDDACLEILFLQASTGNQIGAVELNLIQG